MRIFSRILIASVLGFAGTSAQANPLFNSDPRFSVTDLGASFSYQFGPDGETIQSVTNSAGDETYAFEKSPVEFSSQSSNIGGGPSTTYTYKVGAYSVSNYKYSNNSVVTSSMGWSNGNGQFPVSDINLRGEAVGSVSGSARLTLPGLEHHVIPSFQDNSGLSGSDMLDIYIPPVSGLSWLTSAFRIDDDGRILATGDNGHIYLLSPNTVPEPTSLMMFAVVVAGCAISSVRRSPRRQS